MSDKPNFDFKELKKLRKISSEDESEIEIKPEDEIKAEEQEITFEERQKEAELQRYNDDSRHRKNLVKWATTLIGIWLTAVILILVATGMPLLELSDTVMVTLLSTTTVNVLGLMIIVLNDIFKGKQK
ncbi:MgtC/SapB family protein [Flavobacterium salilacus subsp. salilacus]|uniref:MgtC/SapB family protein n=1 Tax=Flavobacterium TaxID=237 RepID=UPI0010756222|nr:MULTISPECIES: MgtC/SapB family protein [Flavobacterium]KAF2518270.1 MgtC/SapB family protein [Flavobacterium salilacus subsp. salilacus]MBE1615320.1 MgtC/SapB family protein [Flavobacterium sp. SaA2.13]